MSHVFLLQESDDKDLGPSPQVNVEPMENAEEGIGEYGVLVEDAPLVPSKKDQQIAKILEKANKEGTCVLNWPGSDTQAETEFDMSKKIFAGAFPWLFPGGVGDYHEFRELDIKASEWAEKLIMYQDGRFATDKTFGFYVLNFCTRRRNQHSGNFFVKTFRSGKEPDVDSIRQQMQEGNYAFVNEISYWAHNVVGSDSYWRSKKNDLYTWISHHIEMKNGVPNFFNWPNIMRLIEE